MTWEVDWTHADNTGTEVMARNPSSHQDRTREWHLTSTDYLRSQGVSTPTYRRDSWEVDWSKRDGKLVWARNESSKMPAAREYAAANSPTSGRRTRFTLASARTTGAENGNWIRTPSAVAQSQ